MFTKHHRKGGLSVGRLMQRRSETIGVFLSHGMLCVGCSVSPFHTIDEVCAIYGLDPQVLRKELRRVIRGSGPSRRRQQAHAEPSRQ